MSLEGLRQAEDRAIRDFAKAREFAIVTADADFYDLALHLGAPPKVIWLRGCDYPSSMVEGLLRSQAVRIAEFLSDPERSILILRP